MAEVPFATTPRRPCDSPNTLTTVGEAVELVDAHHDRLTTSVKKPDGMCA
jgi:hypothetical protein